MDPISRRLALQLGAASPNADLDDYIRRNQFGHHGAGTNPIGADSDPTAVLDSKLRVRGTANVRVVDASSFPKIPGQFIWAPIATLAEKASDDILKDA
jgi:choline dehydrogenase